MSLWKKYGGVNNVEKVQNVSIDNLNATNFSLKNAYVGLLTVSGEILIHNDAQLKSNVIIFGNSSTKYDNKIGGNLYVAKNAYITNNLKVHNIDVGGEIIFSGNVKLMQNYELDKGLNVNGKIIRVGLLDKDLQLYDISLIVHDKKLGLNNDYPLYKFDIVSEHVNGFSVMSLETRNENVIAQNINGRGITVTAEETKSSINFFNDSSIIHTERRDGGITYSNGGNISIDVSNNIFLNSKVSVRNRNTDKYLQNVYEKSTFCTGTAVSLISDNDFSNTSINIATPGGQGLKIVGGSEITDKTRSSGIIGLLDLSNNFIPSLTITSGKSSVTKKTTIGINKSVPETEKYVLDVNGPIKIGHSEIVMVFDGANEKYHIKGLIFSVSNKLYGFAFGIRFIQALGSRANFLLYTHDGGVHWTKATLNMQQNVGLLNTGCIYESNYGFIGGSRGLLLYSSDGFVTWNFFRSNIAIVNIKDINVILSNSKILITVSYSSFPSIEHYFGYFLLTSIELVNSMNSFVEDTPSMSLNPSLRSLTRINTSVLRANFIIVAGRGIAKMDISNNVISTTTSSLYTHNTDYLYHSIHANSDFIVCVGDGFLSSSSNFGLTWTNVDVGETINDVFVYDTGKAVAVGRGCSLYTTIDAGMSWQSMTDIVIQSGAGHLLLKDPMYNFTSINMVDGNTFILSREDSSDNGHIFYCTFPGVFNKPDNNVLDISGNMRLSGDIHVSDNASIKQIQSDKIRCGILVADNIDSLNGNINIGTVGGGKKIMISSTSTEANPNDIFIGTSNDNVTINGKNLSISGKIATENSIIQLNSGYSGNTGKSAGAGINIRDFNEDSSGFIRINDQLDGFVFKASTIHPNVLNIRVDDMTISNKFDINSKHRIKNGLVILRDSSSVYNNPNISASICTMTTASFDVSNIIIGNHLFQGFSNNQQTLSTDFGVQGNTYMYNSLRVDGDTNLRKVSALTSEFGNLDVSNNLNIIGNATFGRNGLISNGETRLNGNTYITNNSESFNAMSGALQVIGGMSTTGNVFVGGNLNVDGNTVFAKNVNITNIEDAIDHNSGCFRLNGGISVKKSAFILGNIDINSNLTVRSIADTTDISSGSVIVLGGCAIGKSLNVGKNSTVHGNSTVIKTSLVGLQNIVPIIPLLTPFTSRSTSGTGQFIPSTAGGGTYYINVSSILTGSYYNIFNSVPSTDENWIGSGYDISGLYISTVRTKIDNTLIAGDYIQIILPNSIVLTSYDMHVVSPSPKSWILCGSNDGINFFNLDQRSNVSIESITYRREMSACTASYTCFRLVVTSSTSSTTVLNKLFFNGYIQSILNNDNEIGRAHV